MPTDVMYPEGDTFRIFRKHLKEIKFELSSGLYTTTKTENFAKFNEPKNEIKKNLRA
jgi:hypothetical protein